MNTTTDTPVQPSLEFRGKEGKYLGFTLEKEAYGIPVVKVREIIGMVAINSVPNVPDFVKGIINLRDKVIPVIDLRLKFQMEAREYTERTCIIVVEINQDENMINCGIIVDTVSEVLDVNGENIEETPAFGSKFDTSFILGIAKVNSGVKILLDIDQIFSSGEMKVLKKDRTQA